MFFSRLYVFFVMEKDGHDPGPDSGGDDRSGAWVFQANPRRFNLLQALQVTSLPRPEANEFGDWQVDVTF